MYFVHLPKCYYEVFFFLINYSKLIAEQSVIYSISHTRSRWVNSVFIAEFVPLPCVSIFTHVNTRAIDLSLSYTFFALNIQ